MNAIEHVFAPWSELYSNHTIVAMIVMTFHLLALLIGGGFAVSADHASLRARREDGAERQQQLERLARTHTIVIVALAVSFVSGLLLAAADIAVFTASPLFWIKLGVVGVLLVNGGVLRSVETKLRNREPSEALWRRLAVVSRMSMVLWVAAVVVGVALTDFAG